MFYSDGFVNGALLNGEIVEAVFDRGESAGLLKGTMLNVNSSVSSVKLSTPVIQPMRVRFSPGERWLLYPNLNGIVST